MNINNDNTNVIDFTANWGNNIFHIGTFFGGIRIRFLLLCGTLAYNLIILYLAI